MLFHCSTSSYDEDRRAFERRQNLSSSKSFADDDLPLRINSVNLKNALGEIQANNLHLGGSLCSWWFDNFHQFGTQMPSAGAIHPICFAV